MAGTHSTGKSTFLEAIAAGLKERGVSVAKVADLATEARDLGFPILRDHTFESTAWIICRGITRELEASRHARVILVDRPVPDALGYLWAALKSRGDSLSTQEVLYLEKLVQLHSRSYDYIFLTVADLNIPIDRSKERDHDLEFRKLAEIQVAAVFKKLAIPFDSLANDGHANQVARMVEKIYQTSK